MLLKLKKKALQISLANSSQYQEQISSDGSSI